jgi:hypothetical protein
MSDITPQKPIQIQKKKKKCCPEKGRKGSTVRATTLTVSALIAAFALCLAAAWGINEQIEGKTIQLREEVHDLSLRNEVLRSNMDDFCDAGPLRTLRCGDRTDACLCGNPNELQLGP